MYLLFFCVRTLIILLYIFAYLGIFTLTILGIYVESQEAMVPSILKQSLPQSNSPVSFDDTYALFLKC